MQKQDGWFNSFAAKWGFSNLAAGAAAAVEEAVYGTSYSSDDEYAGGRRHTAAVTVCSRTPAFQH